MIVFTDDRLIDETLKLLLHQRIQCGQLTQELNITQRNLIIDLFEKGTVEVLAAMKILDEGVDIPNVRELLF